MNRQFASSRQMHARDSFGYGSGRRRETSATDIRHARGRQGDTDDEDPVGFSRRCLQLCLVPMSLLTGNRRRAGRHLILKFLFFPHPFTELIFLHESLSAGASLAQPAITMRGVLGAFTCESTATPFHRRKPRTGRKPR
jgi:hypothetical protein